MILNHYWMGQPIKDLDKGQLLEVIGFLVAECERLRKDRDAWMDAGDVGKYLKGRHI